MRPLGKEDAFKAARIMALLLIPFIYGAFILPHIETVKGDSFPTPFQNSGGLDSIPYNYSSDVEAPAATDLNSVYPLARFLSFPPFIYTSDLRICLQDTGSTIAYPNGTVAVPRFNWSIDTQNDGREDAIVGPSQTVCVPFKSDTNFTYKWIAHIQVPSSNGSIAEGVVFYPRTGAYSQWKADYGLVQGLALVSGCYLFIWYPLVGIIKKIRDGMMAQ